MSGRLSTDADGRIEAAKHDRHLVYLCWAIIIIGAGLRVGQWVHNRSLWLDESYLAVNILERGFGELHRPLEFSQSAPWLFLVASKAMVVLFGPGEMVLRSIPLLASIFSLWVFWRLARECLEGWVVPVALAIFTFAFRHVYYAQELKQYSVEIMLTTLVLWQAARMFKSAGSPGRCFAGLAITGSLGIFAMHAMPFVLAGTGLVALWASATGRLNLSRGRVAVAISAWLVLFAINYFVIIRPNYSNPVMKNYWAFAYPGVPWTMDGLRSWGALIGEYFWYLGYSGLLKILVGLLLLGGLWRVIRTKNLVLLSGAVTVVAYWLAAIAGKAPFSGRLVLFLFPLLPLFIGQGLGLLVQGRHWLLGLLAATVALGSTARDLPSAFTAIQKEDLRGPILELSRLRKASEPVYVAFWAVPAFRYYRQTRDLKSLSSPGVVLNQQERIFDSPTKKGVSPSVAPDLPQMMREMSGLTGSRNFWLLVAHMPQHEDQFLREIHEALGLEPERSYKVTGSSLYYFDTGKRARQVGAQAP